MATSIAKDRIDVLKDIVKALRRMLEYKEKKYRPDLQARGTDHLKAEMQALRWSLARGEGELAQLRAQRKEANERGSSGSGRLFVAVCSNS